MAFYQNSVKAGWLYPATKGCETPSLDCEKCERFNVFDPQLTKLLFKFFKFCPELETLYSYIQYYKHV